MAVKLHYSTTIIWGKTTMGVLRSTAYNCIRLLMIESIKRKGATECRVSFKGSVQAIRQWEPLLNQITISRNQQLTLMADSL